MASLKNQRLKIKKQNCGIRLTADDYFTIFFGQFE
jgi:hypothetical protein